MPRVVISGPAAFLGARTWDIAELKTAACAQAARFRDSHGSLMVEVPVSAP
jgi:hypothetical protein